MWRCATLCRAYAAWRARRGVSMRMRTPVACIRARPLGAGPSFARVAACGARLRLFAARAARFAPSETRRAPARLLRQCTRHEERRSGAGPTHVRAARARRASPGRAFQRANKGTANRAEHCAAALPPLCASHRFGVHAQSRLGALARLPRSHAGLVGAAATRYLRSNLGRHEERRGRAPGLYAAG